MLIFPKYFLDMDNSLVNAHICLESSIHIAETCLEGSVSQNLDIGLSFCFMVCRRREFMLSQSPMEVCGKYYFCNVYGMVNSS